jgi:hypothetical protein
MTTLALAVALLPLQQKTITFSHPCASAAVVLDALGKELGVRMQPGGSVMQDFIIVRFEDVTVEEALKKIADALNATWTQQNGINVLTRTPAQVAKEDKDALDAATRQIQEWLDKRKVEGQVTLDSSRALIEEVLPLLKTDQNTFNQQQYERQRELESRGPLGRYLTRLLKEIGAASLASGEEGQRIQYVEDPTPKQRQLPMGEALRLFTVENEIYREALNRSGALDRVGQEGTMYTMLIHPYQDRYSQETQTVLTIVRQRGFTSVRLSVPGFGEVWDSITPDREQPTGMPKELLEQPGDYEPTALEKELGQAAKVIFEGRSEAAQISAEAVAALRDPVAHEPLSVFGSKWLLDSSKALGKNLVGVVSDDCFLAGMFISSQGQLGYSQFWKFLPQMGTGYVVGLDEKWLTLYPKAPITTREARIDREQWRRAIARTAPGRQATLEDYAAFAALGDDEMSVMIATLPAILMGHGIEFEALQQGENLDVLRIYGRMTALQQKAARNGGTELLLSRMPQTMSGPVSKLVYAERAQIDKERRVLGWGDANTYYSMGIENDPMRLLPRGYPPASVMRVYVLRKDVVYQQAEARYGREHGTTPEQIAQQIAWSEVYPEYNQHLRQMFALAPAEQLLIEFEFTNVGFMVHRMQVDYLARDAKFVALKDLPEGVRGEIETALKKAREEYKNVRRDGGGG